MIDLLHGRGSGERSSMVDMVGTTDPLSQNVFCNLVLSFKTYCDNIFSEDCSRASTRKICAKRGPRKSHEKVTKKARTLFF